MEELTIFNDAFMEVQEFFTDSTPYRSVLILIASIIAAYIFSRVVSRIIIKIAQFVSVRGDAESNEEKLIMYRQVETYLSVFIAIVRVSIVAVVAFLLWDFLSPRSNNNLAAIGAGTFFLVFAGQTLGMILRDLTVGTAMIAERWYTVGDFVKIEPFIDVSGVVERVTLRATKLRRLSGEVVWIHNQQIQAVQVTPRGVRTIAVDTFVHDRVEGERILDEIIQTIPTGPTMLARPLRITYAERWGDDLWRITVTGQTPPGREWLIENYFINALKAVDEDKKKADRTFTQEPIARYADAVADQRFKRAIRIQKDK